jgi:nucleoside-diphosphate-sugar epimerase
MYPANDEWSGRTVLVTGCTGFLGSAVTRCLLTRGAVVVGLVRSATRLSASATDALPGQFRPLFGRVEDTFRLHSALAIHEVSVVFHLVAPSAVKEDRGTAAVRRAVALHDRQVPLVVARPGSDLRLAVPDDAPSAASPLGVVRFDELFGEGDRKADRLVPRTLANVCRSGGPAVPAPVAPDGRPRDFVYVRDAARACLLVAEALLANPESLDLTFHSGWKFSESTFVQALLDVSAGAEPRAVGVETLVNPPVNPLGWAPRIDFPTAVRETVAWYRQWFAHQPSGVESPPDRKAA